MINQFQAIQSHTDADLERRIRAELRRNARAYRRASHGLDSKMERVTIAACSAVVLAIVVFVISHGAL